VDALEKAKLTMEFASEDEVDTSEARAFFHNKAQTWAAIAQAEQLKRIADVLEYEHKHRLQSGAFGYGE
jgi:hypothetical protein